MMLSVLKYGMVRRMAMATKDILEPSLEMLGMTPYKIKKGEEYMTLKMRQHFTKILTLLRQQIMEGADRTVTHMKDDAINYPDPNDRASQEEEFRLEEALQLLTDKEYGYCEVCGVEIGLRRLEARPTATLCIDCKTLDEIREKQQG
jgi:DnaK suppressor protein